MTVRRLRCGLLLICPVLLAACMGAAAIGTPTRLSAGQEAQIKALIVKDLRDPASARFGAMNAAWQKDALVVCGWLNHDTKFMARFGERADQQLDMKVLRTSDNIDGALVASMFCANAGLAFPG
jgi:hypothetical protein